MKRAHAALATLALGHGLNDCIAGHFLAASAHQHTLGTSGIHFLLYVSLAFAGQIPAALLVDRWRMYQTSPMICFVLQVVAVGLFPFSATAGIVLSGLASALYHAGGGAAALQLPLRTGLSAGVFAAPGIVGLTLGSTWSTLSFSGMLLLALAPLVLALCWFPLSKVVRIPTSEQRNAKPEKFEAHDALMILLLLVITLRSAMWDLIQVAQHGEWNVMLWIAIAAALGKILGGLFSDRLGELRTLGGALLLSLLLLQLADFSKLILGLGVALLQATIAPSIALVRRLLPNAPALSTAVVLGLAVMLGGYPQWISGPWVTGITTTALLVGGLFFWWKARKSGLLGR